MALRLMASQGRCSEIVRPTVFVSEVARLIKPTISEIVNLPYIPVAYVYRQFYCTNKISITIPHQGTENMGVSVFILNRSLHIRV